VSSNNYWLCAPIKTCTYLIQSIPQAHMLTKVYQQTDALLHTHRHTHTHTHMHTHTNPLSGILIPTHNAANIFKCGMKFSFWRPQLLTETITVCLFCVYWSVCYYFDTLWHNHIGSLWGVASHLETKSPKDKVLFYSRVITFGRCKLQVWWSWGWNQSCSIGYGFYVVRNVFPQVCG